MKPRQRLDPSKQKRQASWHAHTPHETHVTGGRNCMLASHCTSAFLAGSIIMASIDQHLWRAESRLAEQTILKGIVATQHIC